jgi:23S rRNA-/tRNA-specific pseudouridylate synthase
MIPLSDAVETLALFEPAALPSPRVLGEGPSFLAVDKPPHEPVLSEPAERRSLLARVRSLPGGEHAVAVDALDPEASGVCLFARTPADAPALESALERATSEALGLVRGVIRAHGRLPAARNIEGDARYERREVLGSASLLVVQAPPSAATEALRAFAKFGHPLLGDARHGDRRANLHFGLRHALERPFWHRRALTFTLGGEPQRLESPLAPDLEAVLASVRAVKA